MADRAPSAAPPPAPAEIPPRGRLRRSREIVLRLSILAAAGIVLLLFTTQWNRWVGDSSRQETDDAYIHGDLTPLSAQIDGDVRHVAVGDFQQVKKGDLLVQIDDSDYQARVEEARAALLGAEAAIGNIKARKVTQKALVAEAEDAIRASKAELLQTRD